MSYLVYRKINVVCGFQKGAADIKRLLNIRRSKADMQNETTRQIQKLVGRYFVVLSRLPIQSVNNTTSLNHNASLLRSLHHEYLILDRCLTNLFEKDFGDIQFCKILIPITKLLKNRNACIYKIYAMIFTSISTGPTSA